MAVSQNGWAVHDSATNLVALDWVTGRVARGDVWTIFDYLARRFSAEVEPIIKAHSWGWAKRNVRGSSSISNHASGTAVDFNAPAHPLGKANTFNAAQRAAIRRILNDLQGVVRWGGDYSGRKDDMHFEINAPAAAVARVAQALRGISAQPAPKPVRKLTNGGPPMIYLHDENGRTIATFAHNGGSALIDYVPTEKFIKKGDPTPKSEYQNLVEAGVKPVWLSRKTSNSMVNDARGIR